MISEFLNFSWSQLCIPLSSDQWDVNKSDVGTFWGMISPSPCAPFTGCITGCQEDWIAAASWRWNSRSHTLVPTRWKIESSSGPLLHIVTLLKMCFIVSSFIILILCHLHPATGILAFWWQVQYSVS